MQPPEMPTAPPFPPPPSAAPITAPPRRRTTGILIGVGIAVAIVVGLILALVLSPGGRLPSELAGEPVLHSETLDGLEEGIEAFDMGGFSVDVAFYGRTPLQPDYVVMVTSGPAPLDPTPGGSLFDELPGGLVSRENAEIDFSRAIEETRDGVEYVCAPGERTDVGVTIAMCVFQEEIAGFVIATDGTDLARLMEVTQRLHDGVA